MAKDVVILNFSSRNGGNCDNITGFIEDHGKNANIISYKIGECFKPCGNCNYECLKQGVGCPNLTERQKQIMMDIICSDITYFIIPNYCGFPCANYFAFNERSVGFFHLNQALLERYMNIKKKFIIVSNAKSDLFYRAMEQQSGDPDIFYLSSDAYQKKSLAGDILTSPAACSDLEAFLEME